MGKLGLFMVLTVLWVGLTAAAPCFAEIRVLDGNRNVLGILLEDTGLHVTIFMPKLEKSIVINKLTGDTDSLEKPFLYEEKGLKGCTGIPHAPTAQVVFRAARDGKLHVGVQPPVVVDVHSVQTGPDSRTDQLACFGTSQGSTQAFRLIDFEDQLPFKLPITLPSNYEYVNCCE
ncbi:MAG: hypothetical protein HY788_03390 [Deltaproteobacteria bacterium]|nr:hypothetical protein [Deltaproteobacteria bacterium]